MAEHRMSEALVDELVMEEEDELLLYDREGKTGAWIASDLETAYDTRDFR